MHIHPQEQNNNSDLSVIIKGRCAGHSVPKTKPTCAG